MSNLIKVEKLTITFSRSTCQSSIPLKRRTHVSSLIPRGLKTPDSPDVLFNTVKFKVVRGRFFHNGANKVIVLSFLQFIQI